MSTISINEEAFILKPSGTKRSLASLLSVDYNSQNTLSGPVDSNANVKKRKLNIDSKWNIKEVPELPFLYLKEKTSVVILNEHPQEVAERIVNCAKSLNAYGQYDGDKVSICLMFHV